MQKLQENGLLKKKKKLTRFKKKKQSAHVPKKRWGHTCVCYKNLMYLFGGEMNESFSKHKLSLYTLDLNKWDTEYQWERKDSTLEDNQHFVSRDSHSACVIGYKMYVFGGSTEQGCSNDLFVYDLLQEKWSEASSFGDIPEKRDAHSSFNVKNRYLGIFAGWNGEEVYDDFYLFDTKNGQWRKVVDITGDPISKRESHCCQKIRNSYYVFGGGGVWLEKRQRKIGRCENFKDDFYKFDVSVDNHMNCNIHIKKLMPDGKKPKARSSFGCCNFLDRYLVIIAGEGYSPEEEIFFFGDVEKKDKAEYEKLALRVQEIKLHVLSDVWLYDTEVNSWINLEISNSQIFEPRLAHTTVEFQGNIFLFGGLKNNNDYVDNYLQVLKLKLNDKDAYEELKNTYVPFRLLDSEHGKIALCQDCKEKIDKIENKVNSIQNEKYKRDTQIQRMEIEIKSPEPFKPQKQKRYPSFSFICDLAKKIVWPLAAFGLLADNSKSRGAQTFKIIVKKRKINYTLASPTFTETDIKTQMEIDDIAEVDNDGMLKENSKKKCIEVDYAKVAPNYVIEPNIMYYLKVQDDSDGFKPSEILPALGQFETTNSTALYFMRLMLSCFRLGQTFLYITTKDNLKTWIFYSSILKKCPENDLFIVVVEDLQKGFVSENGESNRELIMNSLKDIISEKERKKIKAEHGNMLYICNLHKVKDKTYELNFSKNPKKVKNDIFFRLVASSDNSKISQEKAALIDISLKSYLQHLYIGPNKLKIFLHTEEIIPIDLSEKMQPQSSANILDFSKIQNIVLSGVCVEENTRFSQGTLLYLGHRLICRLENSRFGDVLYQNSKKYEKAGYIQFDPDKIHCNLFSTEIAGLNLISLSLQQLVVFWTSLL